MKNILAILAEAGGKPTHICRLTAFCIDKPAYLAGRRELGRIWKSLMGDHFPAMSMIFVADLLDIRQRSNWKRRLLSPAEYAATLTPHGSANSFGSQAPCQAAGGEAAIIGRCKRGAHRLHLLLHQPVDLLQQLVVDRPPGEGLGAGEQERPRIGAGQRDAQRADIDTGVEGARRRLPAENRSRRACRTFA